MKLPSDTARCAGNYLGQHGEFGVTLNPVCIDCARRTQKSFGPRHPWINGVIVSGSICQHKIKDKS